MTFPEPHLSGLKEEFNLLVVFEDWTLKVITLGWALGRESIGS